MSTQSTPIRGPKSPRPDGPLASLGGSSATRPRSPDSCEQSLWDSRQATEYPSVLARTGRGHGHRRRCRAARRTARRGPRPHIWARRATSIKTLEIYFRGLRCGGLFIIRITLSLSHATWRVGARRATDTRSCQRDTASATQHATGRPSTAHRATRDGRGRPCVVRE